jgi:hypothetical protein
MASVPVHALNLTRCRVTRAREVVVSLHARSTFNSSFVCVYLFEKTLFVALQVTHIKRVASDLENVLLGLSSVIIRVLFGRVLKLGGQIRVRARLSAAARTAAAILVGGSLTDFLARAGLSLHGLTHRRVHHVYRPLFLGYLGLPNDYILCVYTILLASLRCRLI